MCRLATGLLFFLLPLAFSGCKSDGLEDIGNYPAATMPEGPVSGPTPARRSVSDHTLQPGDAVELFVEEDDSFNGTYDVRERGDIIIPSVGRIPVRGMNVSEAGSRIRSELESSQLKNATVLLDRVRKAPRVSPQTNGGQKTPTKSDLRITIYMTGSVNRPGQHKVPVPSSGKLGVYEAILMTGGFSNFGDPTRVHLLRNDEFGKKRKIPVNIRNIEKGLAEDPMIGEGDIVVVPEKVLGF